MSSVLFAKKETKSFKYTGKNGQKYWKSQGIFSVGNVRIMSELSSIDYF